MKKKARTRPERRQAANSAANSSRTRKMAQARKKPPARPAAERSAPTRATKSPARKTGARAAGAAARPAAGRSAAGRSPAPREAAAHPKPASRRRPPKPKATRRRLVRDESTILLHLEDLLQQRIVGKDEAIRRVANVIRIRRTNLDFKPHRPVGSFLIVGPPGVGKTEFANAVAEVLLGTDSMVINLDMADYTEEEDVEDLLVTAYPGTEGVLVEGALTTPVRRNPRSVVLFRGIERAHESVRRLLLHILERGTIVDAQGEVSFSQTIMFATTRMETDDVELVEQIGFTRSSIPREERQRKILEEQFSPELVNAFNAVLYFSGLTTEDVRLIARFKVNAVLARLKQQNRGVIISDRVYDTFIKEGEVKKAGARYLNRALEEKLFTPLSKYLLEHATAQSIVIDVQEDHLIIRSSAK
jgi:ATP-dependent Clp protease ATP-binding subunit ClpA